MKHFTIWNHKNIKNTFCVMFWLTVWYTVSLCTPKFLFASPLATGQALLQLIGQVDTWHAIIFTFGKTSLGFLSAFTSATILAVLGRCMPIIRLVLLPAMQVMKSVPVACFVIVALIWISSVWLPVLVSFFVVFPMIYIHVENSLHRLQPELVEMVQVFRVPIYKRIRFVYIPQILPELLVGCKLSVGMCWKAGIAGEIIGLPRYSIGEQLYLSKLYLEVDRLFAWTVLILVISIVLEKFTALILSAFRNKCEDNNED